MSAPSALSPHTENAQRIPTGIASSVGYYVDLHLLKSEDMAQKKSRCLFPLLDHLHLGAVSAFGGIQDHGLLTALK